MFCLLAPVDGAADEYDAETTPTLPQHFAPYEAANAAAGATCARVSSGRLLVGGARADAARKVAFAAAAPRPPPPSTPFDGSLLARCAEAQSAELKGAWVEAMRPPSDVPMFRVGRGHTRALQRSQVTPTEARAASLVQQVLAPSRDRRLVAVSLVWRGGGAAVFVRGSFTGWAERLPMAADSSGAHFVVVSLRAGTYHYAFEVDGVHCVADQEPVCEAAAGAALAGAPVTSANVLTVDDGAEFEGEEEAEGGERAAAQPEPAYSQEVPVEAREAAGARAVVGLRAWIGMMPAALPPHLARLYGVEPSEASQRGRYTRDGPPVEWHSELGHASLGVRAPPAAQGAGCAMDGADGGGYADASSSGHSARDSASDAPGLASSTCVSVAWRWRSQCRVTSVLYSPAPNLRIGPAGWAAPGSTFDSSASLPIQIPLLARKPACLLAIALASPPHLSVAAAAAAAVGNPRLPAARVQSDVSMAAAEPSADASPALAPSGTDSGACMWFGQGSMDLAAEVTAEGCSRLQPQPQQPPHQPQPLQMLPFGWAIPDLRGMR